MAAETTGENEKNNVEELLSTINGLLELASGETVDYDSEISEGDFFTQIDLDALKRQGMFDSQIEEIQNGIKENLAVEIYAKECYNWQQMKEIRKGLLRGVDVSAYTNPFYTAEQMREIRRGLEEGLDVSIYSKLIYSATDMYRKRRQMMAEVFSEQSGSRRLQIRDEVTGAEIHFSADGMEAYVCFPEGDSKQQNISSIKRLLKKHEITYGIIEKNLMKLVAGQVRRTEVQVAEGTKPLQGHDGWYKLFFENNLPGKPRELPDGRVDYSKVIVADVVMPGQLLAQYQPATRGKEGMTVTGIAVKGSVGKEIPALRGSGIIIDEEKGTYHAKEKGYVSYNEKEGTLNVWQTYTANGDINRYTGNIIYDGNVHIRGSVNENVSIQATGDVIVDGFVGRANIHAGNNVILRSGVNADGQGIIEAGNKILGDFFERVTLRAGGTIEGNYFLHCDVETEDKVLAKGGKGIILGGKIIAAIAVESAIIGSKAGMTTVFNVGDIYSMETKIAEMKEQKAKAEDEYQKLVEGKEKLLSVYGEEAVAGNTIYQKTCLAIDVKSEESSNLEKKIDRLTKVKKNAMNANIKVSKTLFQGTILTINGSTVETLESINSATLNKEKILSLRKHK